MGLDMYLSAEKYIGNWQHSEEGEKARFRKVLEAAELTEDVVTQDAPAVTVRVNIGYWRKANAIHKWFVEKVQKGVDKCQDSYVEREQLQELKAECEEVLKAPKKAKKKLPTQGGFFFGPTDYDEYYLEDLKRTVEIIDKALKLEGVSFYYRSSW